MMKRIGLLIAALAAFNATASSPQAWAESERAMRAACQRAKKRQGGRGDRSLRRRRRLFGAVYRRALSAAVYEKQAGQGAVLISARHAEGGGAGGGGEQRVCSTLMLDEVNKNTAHGGNNGLYE